MSESNTHIVASQCISRISQGDPIALGEFYDRYSSILNGLALKILKDRAEAEDVLQETFMHIWQRADTYEPRRSSPSCWAAMILRSKAIDRVRSRNRRIAMLEQAAKERDDVAEVDAHSADEPAVRDQAQQVRSALESLPRDQQEAIRLAFFEGFTHEEIAARLRVPIGTIKSRIRRGMLSMREAFATEC